MNHTGVTNAFINHSAKPFPHGITRLQDIGHDLFTFPIYKEHRIRKI